MLDPTVYCFVLLHQYWGIVYGPDPKWQSKEYAPTKWIADVPRHPVPS